MYQNRCVLLVASATTERGCVMTAYCLRRVECGRVPRGYDPAAAAAPGPNGALREKPAPPQRGPHAGVS